MKKRILVLLILTALSVGYLFAQGTAEKKGDSKQAVEQGKVETTVSETNSEPTELDNASDYERWVYKVTKDMDPTHPVRVFLESGWVAWIILAIFLYSVVFFIQRFMKLFLKEKINIEEFHGKVKKLIQNGELGAAKKATELVKHTTLGQVYRIGLLAYEDAKRTGKKGDSLTEEVQNAFAEAGYQTIPEIDRGLSWFDFLAQSSTYLGLLGTIMGLIQAFSAEGDSTALMAGIRKAMGTTAIGLVAAVIISFLKMFLSSKAEKIISNVDAYSVKIMNVINNTQIQD